MNSTFYPQAVERFVGQPIINHDREADLALFAGERTLKRPWPLRFASAPMFVTTISPEARTWAEAHRPEALVVPVQPTCRGEHARMLAIAAARRLRAVERAGLHREEDAGYWKAVAPTAVRKAAGLRCERGFAHLPG